MHAEKVVEWFWETLSTFTQEELSKFLHFCTGSGRTPVEGFKKLQSNRGEISLFCIETVNYQNTNPYPKAHTCFNRLELPIYPTKEELEIYLKATLNNILVGQFGLE